MNLSGIDWMGILGRVRDRSTIDALVDALYREELGSVNMTTLSVPMALRQTYRLIQKMAQVGATGSLGRGPQDIPSDSSLLEKKDELFPTLMRGFSTVFTRLNEFSRTPLVDTDPTVHHLDRLVKHMSNLRRFITESQAVLLNSDLSMDDVHSRRGRAVAWKDIGGSTSEELVIPSMDKFDGEFQFLSKALAIAARMEGVALRGEKVYKQIRHPRTGHLTYAWSSVGTLDDWIYRIMANDREYKDIWFASTSKDAPKLPAKALATYFIRGESPHFPRIATDRHTFSFSNGLYLAAQDSFVPYDRAPAIFPPPVACNYLDYAVDPFWMNLEDPLDIPTPCFDKIFEHQGYSKQKDRDTLRVIYALFGRLLYDVAEKDNWQIFVFLLGFAGTGKSLVIDALKKFYAFDDLGIISNNIEAQFGLAPVVDAFVCFATEIRRDFKMDQAQFQSAITGESLSAAKKNCDPVLVPNWKAPFMFAGNEMMNFPDGAGSMARRVVPVYFEQSVQDMQRDDALAEGVMAELGAILIKVNRSYLRVLKDWQGETFWKKCPAIFKENQARVRAAMNPLVAFLESDEVLIAKDPSNKQDNYEVEERIFVKAFNEFCRIKGYKLQQWNNDFFGMPLDQKGIVRATKKVGRMRSKKTFLVGVTLEGQDALQQFPSPNARKRGALQDLAEEFGEDAPPQKNQHVIPDVPMI